MAKLRKRSSTRWMLDALSEMDREDVGKFPPEFLCGLRGAIEAGLSCEEITALLVLFTGIYEAGERMTGPELVERAVYLSVMMKGDIDYCTRGREQRQKNKEHHATLLKKRKKRTFKALQSVP